MTSLTCKSCGHTGEQIDFKNGPRGRKIYDECSECRKNMENLVNQRCQLYTYLMKYRSAHIAITIGGDILENFKKDELTPSYLKKGEFFGSMYDSHFVPIANLAFEHALNDIGAGVNLRNEVEEALGKIVSIGETIGNSKSEWNRNNVTSEIIAYTSIPTGQVQKKEVVFSEEKKSIFGDLFDFRSKQS